MSRRYEEMTRVELVVELSRRDAEASSTAHAPRAVHELEVRRREAWNQAEELQKAQRALEESRDRFALLFDFAPVAYLTLDGDGLIQEINLTGGELLARSREQLLGNPFENCIQEADRALFREHFHRCWSAVGEETVELTLEAPDDRRIPVELRTRRIVAAGREASSYRTAVIDLTDRRRAEQAELASQRQLEELNEVLRQRTAEAESRAEQLRRLATELTNAEHRERKRLAQTLHDHLQQLVIAAKMRIDLIWEEIDRPGLREQIQEIQELMDQTIQASRSLVVELSPPVLHDAGLIEGVFWLARWMEEKHGLQVAVDCDEQPFEFDEDTRNFLFRSVRELLFNVVKHAMVEQATVRIMRCASKRLTIEVNDEGAGFSPDVLTDPENKNGGFGLFSIRERLDALGGTLEVESAPQCGATFRMLVPLMEQDKSAELVGRQTMEPPAESGEMAVGRDDGIRVLIVDDHQIMRQGLMSLLERESDIEIVGEAADGVEAIDLAHLLLPDVVIMDVNMPRMNGIEATRRIKEALPDVTVIGLSLHEEHDMALALERAGASSYLTKGGPSQELCAAIRSSRLAAHG